MSKPPLPEKLKTNICGKAHPMVTFYGERCPMCEAVTTVESMNELLGMANTLSIMLTDMHGGEWEFDPIEAAKVAAKSHVEVEPYELVVDGETLRRIKVKLTPNVKVVNA